MDDDDQLLIRKVIWHLDTAYIVHKTTYNRPQSPVKTRCRVPLNQIGVFMAESLDPTFGRATFLAGVFNLTS